MRGLARRSAEVDSYKNRREVNLLHFLCELASQSVDTTCTLHFWKREGDGIFFATQESS